MAFFCPVRIRRNKKKHNGATDLDLGVRIALQQQPAPAPLMMGRITGSASIETLVRVGIEKENGLGPDSKMVVVHDFHPCVDDELEVKRGQMVYVLYQENDWVYVLSENHQQEGFIPASYCAPDDGTGNNGDTDPGNSGGTSALVKKKLPRTDAPEVVIGSGGSTINYQAQVQELNEQFLRNGFSPATDTAGRQEEPDVPNYRNYSPPPQSSVSQPNNKIATVLNLDLVSSTGGGPTVDHIVRSQPAPATSSVVSGSKNASDSGGGGGGKVVDLASNYPAFPKSTTTTTEDAEPTTIGTVLGQVQPFFKDQNGPPYVMLYSFVARNENDCSVDRGQIVTVMNKDDTDWYWIRRMADGQEGFVPAAYVYPAELLPGNPLTASMYH